MKNWKIEKKLVLLHEILLFLAKSELYMFSAFFWGIKHFSSSKFEILTFFGLKNLIFDLRHLTAHSGKSIQMKRLFLVSMEGQRSKYSSGNKFWAVSSLFCQLIKRKIGAGWFDPPPVDNVIPEPSWNRVKFGPKGPI